MCRTSKYLCLPILLDPAASAVVWWPQRRCFRYLAAGSAAGVRAGVGDANLLFSEMNWNIRRAERDEGVEKDNICHSKYRNNGPQWP